MPILTDSDVGISEMQDSDVGLTNELSDSDLGIEQPAFDDGIPAINKLGTFQPSQTSSGSQNVAPLNAENPDYDFTRAAGLPLLSAAAAVPQVINKGMDLAGKGVVAAANLPTTISNKLKGAQPGDPDYTEPAFDADRPMVNLPDMPTEYDQTHPVLKGAYDAAKETLEGLTQPQMVFGLPLLGISGLTEPAVKAFAVQLAANIPSDIGNIADAETKKDATKTWATVAIHALMLKGTAGHALGPETPSESTAETPPTSNAAGQPTPEPAAPSQKPLTTIGDLTGNALDKFRPQGARPPAPEDNVFPDIEQAAKQPVGAGGLPLTDKMQEQLNAADIHVSPGMEQQILGKRIKSPLAFNKVFPNLNLSLEEAQEVLNQVWNKSDNVPEKYLQNESDTASPVATPDVPSPHQIATQAAKAEIAKLPIDQIEAQMAVLKSQAADAMANGDFGTAVTLAKQRTDYREVWKQKTGMTDYPPDRETPSATKENVPAPNESINPIMGNTQSAAGDEINKGSVTTPALSPEPPLSEASSKTEPLPNSEPVKEEVAPSQNKEQPQFVGTGGAIPDEFKNDPQTPTGIRNAMVDSERAKRGLPESMQVAKKGFGTVWDEAMAKIDKDPESQDVLIDELRNKPRALTDVEDAMLLHRQIDLQNEYGKATRDLAQAYDDGRTDDVNEGKVRVANLSDKLLDIYNIGKKVGTESGRGLNARKLMATEDFSLAEMEIQKRAANQGKPLTEQQRQEINDLHKKIQSAQQAHDDYVKATTDRIAKSETARIEAERKAQGVPRFDKRILDHAERIVSKMEGAAKDASTRLKERLSRLSAGVDPTIISDAAIVASAKIARLGLDLARLTDAMVEEYGEKIRSLMPEIWKAANKLVNDNTKDAPDEVKRAVRKGATSTEEQRLKTWKTRTANRIKELQDKISAKDYSKKPRQAVPMDEQALRLKANLERLKQQFKEGLQRDQMKQRTFVEKGGDFIARLRRAFILSNPLVLGKLFAAAVARLGVTPVEEMAGAGIGKAIPDVAKIAPREGGVNLKAEVRSVTQAFTKGMADAWKILKTGKSNLDVAYGEMEPQPRHWIDFVGSIHGALKAPVKRAEFARSFEKRAQFYANKGVDITNPLVQAKIGLEAYKDANKSIFMQDNFMASRINRFFSSEKDKTGHETLAGKAWSTTGNVLLPIRKIPTNIVAEGIRYMTGTATGSVRLAVAFKNGIENLKPEQADLIMGDLKKGTLGAAALLYGYFNYKNVGGYYDGKKRKTGDVKFGDIVIGGNEIDHTYLHNPFLENIQIGANMRRVMEASLSKGENKPSAISEAAGASALGLIYEAPFVREMTEVSKAFNPNERGAFFGELGKSLLVPQFVSWTAEHMDKNAQGETNKRAPKSVVQHIETGIPKLRENVPLSKK